MESRKRDQKAQEKSQSTYRKWNNQQPQDPQFEALKFKYGIIITKFVLVPGFIPTTLHTQAFESLPGPVKAIMIALEKTREAIATSRPAVISSDKKFLTNQRYLGIEFHSESDYCKEGEFLVTNQNGLGKLVTKFVKSKNELQTILDHVEKYFQKKKIIDLIELDEIDILDKAIEEYNKQMAQNVPLVDRKEEFKETDHLDAERLTRLTQEKENEALKKKADQAEAEIDRLVNEYYQDNIEKIEAKALQPPK